MTRICFGHTRALFFKLYGLFPTSKGPGVKAAQTTGKLPVENATVYIPPNSTEAKTATIYPFILDNSNVDLFHE